MIQAYILSWLLLRSKSFIFFHKLRVGEQFILLSQIISKINRISLEPLHSAWYTLFQISCLSFQRSLFFKIHFIFVFKPTLFFNYGCWLWCSFGVIDRPFKMNRCRCYECVCVASLCRTFHLSDHSSAVFLTLTMNWNWDQCL